MRKLWILGVLCSSILLAPAGEAGCWSCSTTTDCCVEAARETFGKDLCRHDQLHVGDSVSCNDCWASGSSCAGTGEPECDKPLGTCEEHQTFLIVPHGQMIDLSMLTQPPVAEPSGIVATNARGLCSAV